MGSLFVVAILWTDWVLVIKTSTVSTKFFYQEARSLKLFSEPLLSNWNNWVTTSALIGQFLSFTALLYP